MLFFRFLIKQATYLWMDWLAVSCICRLVDCDY
jgi:hypothetical protein